MFIFFLINDLSDMLKRLYAKNYALLKEITVEFNRGLNIITGETGAGKSIIVGALGAILGEKIDTDTIRPSDEKVILEGEFEVGSYPKLNELLAVHELPDSNKQITLRREVSQTGRSRAFVNDQPTTTAVLEKVGELLVDLHGQHEHQSLLRVETHCSYLDAFGQLQSLVVKVSESYARLVEIERKLKDLRHKEQHLREMKELYGFQLREIEAINPQLDEDDKLEHEERKLKNAELLYQKSSTLYSELYDNETAILDRLSNSISILRELELIDDHFKPLTSEAQSAQISLDEVASSLQRYITDISFDSERLEEIRIRLNQLNGLKKKYGGSIKTILNHKSECERNITLATNFNLEIDDLTQHLAEERKRLSKKCVELSGKRNALALELEKRISEHLSELGMQKTQIRVSVRQRAAENGTWIELDKDHVQVTPAGIDHVEFEISANPGESLKPLAKIASGGEISRVMLALKSVLAKVDKVPVLVFDEIDIGISGRIAQSVGKSLRVLSSRPQVICITHLAQIASMADYHYYVEKRIKDQTTTTSIRKLDDEEHVQQIARLLGGENVTEAHLKGATDLIAEGRRLVNPEL